MGYAAKNGKERESSAPYCITPAVPSSATLLWRTRNMGTRVPSLLSTYASTHNTIVDHVCCIHTAFGGETVANGKSGKGISEYVVAVVQDKEAGDGGGAQRV